MTAKELRIGNLIEKDGQFLKVTAIYDYANEKGKTLSAFSEHLDCFEMPFDEFNPIPLTEEWLLKAGFERDEYDILRHPILKCRLVTNDIIGRPLNKLFLRFDSIIKPYNNKGVCADIYFVHQLQNIHFALTNTELTFN